MEHHYVITTRHLNLLVVGLPLLFLRDIYTCVLELQTEPSSFQLNNSLSGDHLLGLDQQQALCLCLDLIVHGQCQLRASRYDAHMLPGIV